jgi:hypothetical protein
MGKIVVGNFLFRAYLIGGKRAARLAFSGVGASG